MVQLKREKGHLESLFVFTSGESIQGTVHVKVPSGKPIEHQGIKIEFLGQIGKQIDMDFEKNNEY